MNSINASKSMVINLHLLRYLSLINDKINPQIQNDFDYIQRQSNIKHLIKFFEILSKNDIQIIIYEQQNIYTQNNVEYNLKNYCEWIEKKFPYLTVTIHLSSIYPYIHMINKCQSKIEQQTKQIQGLLLVAFALQNTTKQQSIIIILNDRIVVKHYSYRFIDVLCQIIQLFLSSVDEIDSQLITRVFAKDNVKQLLTIDYIAKNTDNHIWRSSIYKFVLDKYYAQNQLKYDCKRGSFQQINQQLSFLMYENNIRQVSKQYTELWNMVVRNELFLKDFITKIDQQRYSFTHQSIFLFNASSYIIRRTINKNCSFKPQLIIRSLEICTFIKQMFWNDDFLSRAMRQIVLQSRINKSISQSAAVAITLLNIVGQIFVGMDLRGVSLPNAVLTSGYLQNVDLSESNLQNVRFDRCQCINVKFNGSDMRGAVFKQTTTYFNEQIKHMDIDNTGNYIVIAGMRKFRIYETKGMKNIKQWEDNERVSRIRYSNDAKMIISSDNQTIKIWDIITGNKIKLFTTDTFNGQSLCPHSDGKSLICGTMNKKIKILDIQTENTIKILQGHDDIVNTISLSPNENIIASGSDKIIKLWNIQNGYLIHNIQAHNKIIYSICFSPDSKRIVSSSKDTKIKTWNVKTGQNITTLNRQYKNAFKVSYYIDGQRILSNDNQRIKIWSQKNNMKLLQRHRKCVNSVSYTPDGQRIISCSDDKSIKIWSHYVKQQNSLLNRPACLYLRNIQFENIIGFDNMIDKLTI